MTYLERKDIRLKWHEIALSEYWRNKQIPRGLRINKKPTLGNQDPEFRKKWEQILNKCSMDLMLLIIEQSKQESSKIKTELQELKTTLRNNMDTTSFTTMETELKQELAGFEDQLKAYKIKKYERDAEDYRRGSVYDWTLHHSWKPDAQRSQRPRRRRAPGGHRERARLGQRRELLLTCEEETSDQGQTSASSTD